MRQTESRHVGQSIDCFSLKMSAKTWSEFRKNNTSHHEVTTLGKTYIKIKIQIRQLGENTPKLTWRTCVIPSKFSTPDAHRSEQMIGTSCAVGWRSMCACSEWRNRLLVDVFTQSLLQSSWFWNAIFHVTFHCSNLKLRREQDWSLKSNNMLIVCVFSLSQTCVGKKSKPFSLALQDANMLIIQKLSNRFEWNFSWNIILPLSMFCESFVSFCWCIREKREIEIWSSCDLPFVKGFDSRYEFKSFYDFSRS